MNSSTRKQIAMLPFLTAILILSFLFTVFSCKAAKKPEAPVGEGSAWQGEKQDNRKDLRASEPFDISLLEKEFSRQETLEGSLKRGNIDLSQATIAYFGKKAGSTQIDTSTLLPEKEELTVVDHGPTGELPVEMRRPTIYVMFNNPMVPLAKLGEPITESPIMRIDPPVEGVYRWYGTRVLSFEPTAVLSGSPRYAVTVVAGVKSMGGRALGKDYRFDFFTETVKVVNFYAGKSADTSDRLNEVPLKTARYAILEFNQNIDPGHIAEFITVKAGSKDVGFKAARPAYPKELETREPRALLLTLDREPPENTKVTITLSNGASPMKGYPGRKGDQPFTFKTVTPFTIRDLDSYSYDLPRDNKPGTIPVYVDFSHDIESKAATLAWIVQIDGTTVTPASMDRFGDVLRITLQGASPGSIVTVQAPKALKDVYDRILSNSDTIVKTKIPEPYPFVSFYTHDFNHLEAAFPPKLIWEARNLDSMKLGISGKPGYNYANLSSVQPKPVQLDISSWKRNKVHYGLEELKPYLNDSGFGTVYFNWNAEWTDEGKYRNAKDNFAVQVTDMGITTRYAYNRILIWVNSLSTGMPIAQAKVSLSDKAGKTKKTAQTDAAGLASFSLEPGEFLAAFTSKDNDYDIHATVEKGKDRADMSLGNTHNAWESSILNHSRPNRVEAPRDRVFIFTDRGLYKGGEELALRGIHWIQNPRGFAPFTGNYELKLFDPRNGSLIWNEKAKASISGGFAHRFKLPKGLEPGSYRIQYFLAGEETGGVDFTISQFRRLAFQVGSAVPQREFYQGDEASVEVKASYLAGGAMSGASYSYYWTRKPQSFVPPGTQWKEYVFGPREWEGDHTLSSGKGSLSASGSITIKEKTEGQIASGSAYSYALETTVTDIDRQAVASYASVLVHPAAFYIGARFASASADGWWSRFVSTEQSIKLETILVDPRGRVRNDDVKLKSTLVLGSWKATEQQGVYGRVNTRWEYVEQTVQEETVQAKGGKASLSFKVKDSGDYLLTIEGKDSKGMVSRTAIRFYATGSAWARRATETPSSINLMADKEEYLPGETARILVRSPVPDGKYLMTIEREGIFEERIVSLSDGKSILELPIKDSWVPVIYVALSSCTKRESTPVDYFEPDLGQPRSLFGILGIRISTRPVELDVEVKALAGAYKPGAKAEVLVRVTRDGKPVANGEVTVMAVDRGVLDLINYHVPNPIEFFYDPSNFPLAVQGDDSRRLLLKPVTYDTSILTGGDGTKLEERKDFRPLALFEPFVRTDSNGVAKMSFTLPDSLTTYRLTAIALKENRIGMKEGELLVQNPINIRTALPRSFRNRDTAAAGIVLQNLTRVPQKVNVTAQSDILSIAGEKTRSIEIPSGGVYELPFLLSATRPGEGTITFTLKSDVINESVTEKVTVERPLVKEAFSTVGSIAKDSSEATEGIVIPSAIAPGYGSLTLIASSSMRPYMEPALLRLLEETEPWWGYYMRITHAFAAVYAGTDEAAVNELLAELKSRQQPGGGIYTGSYNWRPYAPDPYVSLVCAQFLEFAASRSFKIKQTPDGSRLLSYLESLKTDKEKQFDPYFKAYLAYTLAASGRPDPAFMRKVEDYEDSLGLGGYGLLAQAYLAAGNKEAAQRVYLRSKNFILMGTQKIDVKETYETTQYFSSLLAEMALMLKNSVALGEDPNFVQRLSGSLNRGERYWQTRNDDLWTLLAFIPILDAEGQGTNGASLSISVDASKLAALSLTKAQPQAQSSLEFDSAPMASLPRDKLLPLAMRKQGDAPVYYTSILRYALPSETALSRDEGIEVTSRYEKLDGNIVKENALVLGETYRVRTNVSTNKRRSRLELLVSIPNGAEIVDPSFVTSGKFANQGGSSSETIGRETTYGDQIEVIGEGYGVFSDDDWYWYRYNPDSFALDNMMVYRWTDFYAGTREVTFLVRVTTPGIYPTPPVQASLEFEPEVFGRSEGMLFVIKP